MSEVDIRDLLTNIIKKEEGEKPLLGETQDYLTQVITRLPKEVASLLYETNHLEGLSSSPKLKLSWAISGDLRTRRDRLVSLLGVFGKRWTYEESGELLVIYPLPSRDGTYMRPPAIMIAHHWARIDHTYVSPNPADGLWMIKIKRSTDELLLPLGVELDSNRSGE